MNRGNYILSLTLDTGAGGIATSLVNYSKALALINIKHKVILPKTAVVIPELQSLNNVDVYSYSGLTLKCLMLARYIFTPKLKKLFADASIIFLHNSKLLKNQTHPEKTFVICHSGKFRYFQYAKNIIFLTSTAKKRFDNLHPDFSVSLNKIVISHGFITKDISPNSNKTNNIPKIISGGRFVEKKRFQDLIKAANILEKEQVEFELNIYGKGPLEKSINNLIKRFNLKNVHLHPWTENLTDILSKSDIFCLTSKEEPFGLILGEAMLCELAVVATNTDGPLELLGEEATENNGGYIYPCEDIECLAKCLTKLCRDASLRNTLGKNARKNIEENFSLTKLAQNINKLLADY